MSPEQRTAVDTIRQELEGKSRQTFTSLADAYPNALSQKQLADLVENPEKLEQPEKQLAAAWARIGVRIKALRERLAVFYDNPKGKSLMWRVQIPLGEGYALGFKPNIGFYVREFWWPHMHEGATDYGPSPYPTSIRTLISFTELLFFRNDQQRCFFRHLDINDDTSQAEFDQIAKRGHPLATIIAEKGTHSSHFFTTTGEMSCVLRLTKMFEHHRVPNEDRPQHKMPPDVRRYSGEDNLLLIGNKRTHPLIRSIQQDEFYTKGWRWRIGERGIDPIDTADGSYEDFEVRDGRRLVYALVTRMPSRGQGRVVTVIAGNHGRAFEGVAELLTSDDHLRDLFRDDLEWPNEEPLPERFQIVFSVEVNEMDEKIQPGATVVDRTDSLKTPSKRQK